MRIDVRIDGIPELKNMIEKDVRRLQEKIDLAVERRTLKMINETKAKAPVKTGKLRNSIDLLSQETELMQRAYGTNVEYARRQEYEHQTKKGFFRTTVAKHEPLLQKDIRQIVDGIGGV